LFALSAPFSTVGVKADPVPEAAVPGRRDSPEVAYVAVAVPEELRFWGDRV
jgi:hypothetical protein